jgi:hypothetical protein
MNTIGFGRLASVAGRRRGKVEREGMEHAEVVTAIHEFGGFTEQCARTMQNHREQLGQGNLLVVSQFSRELGESRNSC